MEQNFDIDSHLKKIRLPEADSQKGDNGKLLIIGGSELFHAASRWSLDVASHFVDMVFYSSIPENNQLIREAKSNFWNGIVVEREDLERYIEEADAILIGPGMMRADETTQLTNWLVSTYPQKKIVLDAGALQMVEISLLSKHHILTPSQKEMGWLKEKGFQFRDTAVLLKGQADIIYAKGQEIEIKGGNAGMTKGGTGDVLSGLVAALYCKHDALTSCVVGSFINKKTAEVLAEKVGPFFNATDLVKVLPEVFWLELNRVKK